MTVAPAPAKVLVTGANGYIAVWVVRTLLERGYSVRGTVRSESKATYLRQIFKNEVSSGRLEFVIVPDITIPGAFDEAVNGVDAIEHTASPFSFQGDDPSVFIEPAVKGTLGILESALKHGGKQLKRIVVTSSTAAVFDKNSSGLVDESSWNEASIASVREQGRDAPSTDKYFASKSLAEKAAWEFISKNDSVAWDLVTLCPPWVFGPVISEVNSPAELGSSMRTFSELLLFRTQSPEALVDMQVGWVDVRDVALAHARALEAPEAGGQRFILCSSMHTWQEWLDAANSLNIPGYEAPTATPGAENNHKPKFVLDSTKARSILGINFRDIPTTTEDSIKDLKARGW